VRRREFAGFVAPSVVFMTVLLVVPLALTLYLSATAYTYGSAAPTFVGLGNYAEVLVDGVFWSSTGFTVFYTVVTTRSSPPRSSWSSATRSRCCSRTRSAPGRCSSGCSWCR
jgi:ABC-type sugar transport system permease subunit